MANTRDHDNYRVTAKQTTKVIPVPPPTKEVTITMPFRTAVALKFLLGRAIIGPDDGPRGALSEIFSALERTDIREFESTYASDLFDNLADYTPFHGVLGWPEELALPGDEEVREDY